jgi:site-specific recombinase XerD
MTPTTASTARTGYDRRTPHSKSTDDHHEFRVGPIDHFTIDEVLAEFPSLTTWETTRDEMRPYQIDGARRILEWLSTFSGEGWQQRWVASGADAGNGWITDLVERDTSALAPTVKRERLLRGIVGLLLCRAVLPSYDFLYAYKPQALYHHARREFSPDAFGGAEAKANSLGVARQPREQALHVIAKIALHTGKDVADLAPGDVLELRAFCLRTRGQTHPGVALAWVLLREVADMGEYATMQEAIRLGKRPTSELVDRYRLRDSEVRKVLIRYLDERRPALDYSSFLGLVADLANNFWADIDRHHPDLDTLRLPTEIADAWKARLRTIEHPDGTTRNRSPIGYLQILVKVRAFYLDLQEWAMEDPSWAQWAAPSPVRRGETDGYHKTRGITVATMHQRVRDRLPKLPMLLDAVDQHRTDQHALLTAATGTAVGETFTHHRRGFRRVVPSSYATASQKKDAVPPVVIEDLATGDLLNVTTSEGEAFWSWAIVETLRHTGVRIEELTELTHLALISYKLPDTREIVPMLQIVPSKSNQERLLLISPELANVLAAIIIRLRQENGGTIPLTRRYDRHERTTGPVLPHLFQRRRGSWRWSVLGPNTVREMLNRTLDRADLRDAAGQPLRFTAHDFRRIFATEAVNGGLPVHIVSQLLGHANINTTQAYTAIFEDDLVRTYRAFLGRRRAERPATEYREPTDNEWREFQQHFHERKLELGECGRPYGTSCKHEHARIRCPSLRLDPKARPRLIVIIANLKDRIQEARINGWLGEVQGLQISLDAAVDKLTTLDRLRRQRPNTSAADLGIPIIKDA